MVGERRVKRRKQAGRVVSRPGVREHPVDKRDSRPAIEPQRVEITFDNSGRDGGAVQFGGSR